MKFHSSFSSEICQEVFSAHKSWLHWPVRSVASCFPGTKIFLSRKFFFFFFLEKLELFPSRFPVFKLSNVKFFNVPTFKLRPPLVFSKPRIARNNHNYSNFQRWLRPWFAPETSHCEFQKTKLRFFRCCRAVFQTKALASVSSGFAPPNKKG